MKKEAAAILISLVAFCLWAGLNSASAQSPGQAEAAKRFVGLWRLVSVTTDGKVNPDRGANAKGLIYYGPSGHMIVQIAPDRERNQAGPKPTCEEAQNALVGYTAYMGTYSIDEKAGTVTHDRWATVQPGPVRVFVRKYEFAPGNRLILRPVDSKNELIWERVE